MWGDNDNDVTKEKDSERKQTTNGVETLQILRYKLKNNSLYPGCSCCVHGYWEHEKTYQQLNTICLVEWRVPIAPAYYKDSI